MTQSPEPSTLLFSVRHSCHKKRGQAVVEDDEHGVVPSVNPIEGLGTSIATSSASAG